MDIVETAQDKCPVPSEAAGYSLADNRTVQVSVGRQAGFGKINYWTMCKQLKKVMAECGIEKQISYHCARHTFGTLALSKGMPIESVSRVLGHTNIVTTQIYANDNHAET